MAKLNRPQTEVYKRTRMGRIQEKENEHSRQCRHRYWKI